MICPVCEENEKSSTVSIINFSYENLIIKTYYDENGELHTHDPNIYVTKYRCSNNHIFTISGKSHCDMCDFGKNTRTVEIL